MCLRALVISVLVIFSYSLLLSQSNEGTEFWFGFMEHRDPGNTKVIMITSRVNTSGTIRVPGREFSIPFTVNANDVTVFDNLPIFLETRGSEFINDNAIQIISDDPVSVYIHQFFGMRSEASLVLPKSSVGKEYYVMAYTGVPNGQFGNELYTSEFLIVANEDDTVIEFSLSSNSFGGKLEGSGHQIELDRGEVYQLKGQSWLDDLSGSHITANKPFSLFAGTNWSQVPTNCTFMDNLMEQMFPVSTWGRRYVGSPFSGSRANIYRVIAAEDLTNVRVEGSSVSEIVLNAGAYADFQSDDGVFIESDKAISVAQYLGGEACNGGVGDPSMVVLNTVEQIRDTVTLFNSRFQNIQSNFIQKDHTPYILPAVE